MVIRNDYEISEQSAVRHWDITTARLVNSAAVTETDPTCVTSAVAGTCLTGTVLTMDAAAGMSVVDFTPSMVYEHSVRNVLTYNAGAEATWGAINEGDPIFYDASATMPANVYLSTSPLDSAGAANPLFGFAVLEDENDTLPVGAGVASTQVIAVMQVGAGR